MALVAFIIVLAPMRQTESVHIYDSSSEPFHLVFSDFVPSNTGVSKHTVENGVQTQKFTWNIDPNIKNIIIPESELVLLSYFESSTSTSATLVVEKSLDFRGHPPTDIKFKHWTNYMGLCYKFEGKDTIILGTFGEWHSKEGGANIKIDIKLPSINSEISDHQYHVIKRGNLSGQQSESNEKGTKGNSRGSYWYTNTAPSDDWTVIT